MTDTSKRELIEEAAKAMYFEDCGFAALDDDAEPFRDMARVAFAVFEQAHAKELDTSPAPVKNGADSLHVEQPHTPVATVRDRIVDLRGGTHGTSEYGIGFRAGLLAAIAAIDEQAHTPTDDEREAAWEAWTPRLTDLNHGVPTYSEAFDAGWTATLRRTAVPEPQGEPTDAQVDAGCVAFYEHATGLTSWARLVEYDKVLANRYRDGMRRALRAAYETKGEGR